MRKFNAICKELDDERDTRKSNDEIYTIMKADAKRAGLIKEDTDRKGAIYEGREGLNPIKEEMAKITNFNKEKGCLHPVALLYEEGVHTSG